MFDVINLLLGLVVNGLVIAVLLNINKMNSQKIKLSILSLISTIIIAIIPILGYRVDNDFGHYYFGFPADALVYRGGWLFTFASFGLIFNFFFFYWIFKLILKIWKLMVPIERNVNDC
ncbi:hypothetical protein E2R56_31445 [Rhodococcus qingshengii]|nr:hypothetical protein E2R56_31445 [Rhodococcus qingshengii]